MTTPLAPTAPAPGSAPPASGSPPSPPAPTTPTPTPTPVQPASPTSPFASLSTEEKDRIIAQQAQVIRDNARVLAENESRLKALEKKTEPPPPTKGEAAKAFFEDPVGIIRQELREQNKPLIEFKETFERQSAYEGVKAQFKNDPRFKDFLAFPGVEAMIDQVMHTMAPTPAAFQSVVSAVRGGMEFGDIPKPAGLPGAPPAPRGNEPNLTPPHLRPTPAPTPSPEEKGDGRLKARIEGMTENQRRLCREWNMKPEDYFAWEDAEAAKVVHAEIGKEPKK